MSPRKLLLIGWDAADWAVIHPLMDRGDMPNLQRVIETGVMGKLATLDPPISPLLWTSIATETATSTASWAFSSRTRFPAAPGPPPAPRAAARQFGISCIKTGCAPTIVNWFASHPAEPIRGVCVSNVACTASAEVPAGAVYLLDLAATLMPLRRTPSTCAGKTWHSSCPTWIGSIKTPIRACSAWRSISATGSPPTPWQPGFSKSDGILCANLGHH